MTVVKEEMPDHIVALLGYVFDDIRRELTQTLPDRSGLRPSQLRLLSLTPADGMRVTDLAERVGMTKQALGEFANDLEERGLLESVRDPADRRVRILRPTRQGRQAVAAGELVITELEAQWRDRLGARKWDRLRSLLQETAALSP
ncbi:MAG: MarR family winged helix-turn-helix transcriptional regulator [Nocardioides sp.]